MPRMCGARTARRAAKPACKTAVEIEPKARSSCGKTPARVCNVLFASRSSCAAVLTRWLCRLGRRCNARFLIAAIRLALATLDRVAGRTTVPSARPAADGTSIGLTHAALHRIARRAAVPSSPAISIAVRRRRTVSRRRLIILCIDNRRAADGRSADQTGRQSNSCDCVHS